METFNSVVDMCSYGSGFASIARTRPCSPYENSTLSILTNVTLDPKTSHKCQSFEIEIYTAYVSWINKLSIDVGFVKIGQYLAEIQLLENLNLRVQKNLNIAFKTVQMKFLAMHMTNKTN